jgi:hypothetical protein
MQHTVLYSETILGIFEHTLKVRKPNKTDIFNIQLVHIYKTYIFCNSIIYKNNSFSVSKISH